MGQGLGSKLYPPDDEKWGAWAHELAQTLVHKTDGFAFSFQLKTLLFNPKNSPGLTTVVNPGQGMGHSSQGSGPYKTISPSCQNNPGV